MNAKERVLCAAHGGMADCVPVAPYIGNYGAALDSMPIRLYNTNGKRMAEAQARAWEKHRLDMVVAQSDNYYIAEAFGVKIEQPENDTPFVIKTAIDSLEEVDRLPTDVNVYHDGRMYVYLEAVSRLKEIFGDELAIRGAGTGMFTLACHMLGTENLVTEIAVAEIEGDEEQLQRIHYLMELMTKTLTDFSKALLDCGVDVVICGDSAASPDLISPAMYKKYVYPYEVKYFSALKSSCEEHHAVRLLHICGDTTPILPLMCKTGTDIVEIDHKVNLCRAREIAGSDLCLMGNLDPVSVLLEADPKTIACVSEQAIRDAGQNGALILGSGCEVAVRTPLENILALREAGHSHYYR